MNHDDFLDAPTAAPGKHDDFLDAPADGTPHKLPEQPHVAGDVARGAELGAAVAGAPGAVAGGVAAAEVGDAVRRKAGELVEDAKGTAKMVGDNLLPAAGASEGAALGAETLIPLGPWGIAIGALGGAYLGGAAGGVATDLAKAKVPGGAKSAREVAADAVKAGEAMELAEGGARGLTGSIYWAGKGAEAMLPPLEKRAPNVVKAVRAALSKDILPSMATVKQSRFLAGAEEIASKVPFIGRRIMAMRAEQEAAYNLLRQKTLDAAGHEMADAHLGAATSDKVMQYLDDQLAKREKVLADAHQHVLSKYGPGKELDEISQVAERIRSERTELERRKASEMYEAIEKSIPDEKNNIPGSALRAKAEEIHNANARLPEATYAEDVPKEVSDLLKGPGAHVVENRPGSPFVQTASQPGAAGNPLATGEAADALKNRTGYTYGELQTLRSSINGKLRQAKMTGATQKERYYGQLKDALDKDLNGFYDSLGPDVKAMKKAADANYRIFKGKFANDAMETLAKTAKDNPTAVYRVFMKPNNAGNIGRLREVVGEEGFAPFRQKFVRDLVTGKNGEVLGTADILKNLAAQGDTLKATLAPEQAAELAQYARTRPVMDQAAGGKLPQFLSSEMERHLRGVVMESAKAGRPAEDVVKHIVSGDAEMAQALSKILPPEDLAPYRRKIMEKIIGAPAEMERLGAKAPPTAARMDKNLQAYGEPFLKAMGFSKDMISDLGKIEDIKALLESQKVLAGNLSGTASSGIAHGATGAAALELAMHPLQAGAFALHNPLGAGTLILGPELMSRFYASPEGRKLVIEGLSSDFAKNAAKRAEFGARMSAYLGEAIRQHREETGKDGVEVIPSPPQAAAQVDAPAPVNATGGTATSTSTMSPRAQRILGY